MESFNHTLKTELVHHGHFRRYDEARAAVFDDIEQFHEQQRIHSLWATCRQSTSRGRRPALPRRSSLPLTDIAALPRGSAPSPTVCEAWLRCPVSTSPGQTRPCRFRWQWPRCIHRLTIDMAIRRQVASLQSLRLLRQLLASNGARCPLTSAISGATNSVTKPRVQRIAVGSRDPCQTKLRLATDWCRSP